MEYLHSTRNGNELVSSFEAIAEGLAKDGGLFVPNEIKPLKNWQKWSRYSYIDLATEIFAAVFPDWNKESLRTCVKKAYTDHFDTKEVTPLSAIGDAYLLELYHGPTCAFKDVALTILPHLLVESKKQLKKDKNIHILTATSGDTGKAALEGFKDVEGVAITVLYPDNKVSDTQKAQMVTTTGKNVDVVAIEGNFDDCQKIVKEMMEHPKPLKKAALSSANSINIGRLVPQVVYYFKAYFTLVNDKRIAMGDVIDFVVPTGNFGNILAGYFAKLLGCPVRKLVLASNQNNVLSDFIQTGVYDANRPFYTSMSPSIDILISSNVERLLYLVSQDPDWVAGKMNELKENRKYTVEKEYFEKIRETFCGYYLPEQQCADAMYEAYHEDHRLIDPHTAVAYGCMKQYKHDNVPCVVLATASPYKFASAVLQSIGEEPAKNGYDSMRKLCEVTGEPVPASLADLKHKEVRFTQVLPKETAMEELWKKLEVLYD